MNTTELSKLIEDELAVVSKNIGTTPTELYEPIRYIVSLGGKRIRPLLTLLSCNLFGGNPKDALPAAIAIELFHNFSLIHDDIMDKAPLRRNNPTVHEKWNNNIAILSGDVLLVKAYQEICKTKNTTHLPQLLELFNTTATLVCEGQQLDMNYEKADTVSIFNYLKMIELKTAVLLATSLEMGAIIAGANANDCKNIYQLGKNIGIAFQLQDDILDIYGDTEKFGKLKGGDIIANKKTFLLLKAIELSKLNAYKKEELNMWLNAPAANSQDKINAVTEIYNFLDVKTIAEKEMQSYYNKAQKNIADLSIEESAKQELISFIENLLQRKN